MTSATPRRIPNTMASLRVKIHQRCVSVALRCVASRRVYGYVGTTRLLGNCALAFVLVLDCRGVLRAPCSVCWRCWCWCSYIIRTRTRTAPRPTNAKLCQAKSARPSPPPQILDYRRRRQRQRRSLPHRFLFLFASYSSSLLIFILVSSAANTTRSTVLMQLELIFRE